MKPQAISFDLDGTLVDTADEIAEAANRTLVDLGLAPRSPPCIRLLIGRGAHALMSALLAQAVTQNASARVLDEAWALQRFDEHYADITGQLSAPYAGAHEALELLRRRGLRLACVTNKEFFHARRLLQRHGLHRAFDLLVGGDSLPWKKPDGRVLRNVANALGVPRSALVHVGDSAVDVEAARNAGVRAWVLPHGYNAGRPVAEAHPDALLPDLLSVASAALAPAPVEAELCASRRPGGDCARPAPG